MGSSIRSDVITSTHILIIYIYTYNAFISCLSKNGNTEALEKVKLSPHRLGQDPTVPGGESSKNL